MLRIRRPALPHVRRSDVALPGRVSLQLGQFQQHYPGLPYFRVLAKSERRHGNTHVAYTRYVDVEVFGHTVRLDKSKRVYVSSHSDFSRRNIVSYVYFSD